MNIIRFLYMARPYTVLATWMGGHWGKTFSTHGRGWGRGWWGKKNPFWLECPPPPFTKKSPCSPQKSATIFLDPKWPSTPLPPLEVYHVGLWKGPKDIQYGIYENCFRVIWSHAGIFWVMKRNFGSWRLFIEFGSFWWCCWPFWGPRGPLTRSKGGPTWRNIM